MCFISLYFVILGTSASTVNFQAYLLDGLCRWKQDRASASLAKHSPAVRCYSSSLLHAVNHLSEEVLGQKLVPDVMTPGVYTGKLFGVDYLFRQTGEPLQDMGPADPDAEETTDIIEEEEEDEGFFDRLEDLAIAEDPLIDEMVSLLICQIWVTLHKLFQLYAAVLMLLFLSIPTVTGCVSSNQATVPAAESSGVNLQEHLAHP